MNKERGFQMEKLTEKPGFAEVLFRERYVL